MCFYSWAAAAAAAAGAAGAAADGDDKYDDGVGVYDDDNDEVDD